MLYKKCHYLDDLPVVDDILRHDRHELMNLWLVFQQRLTCIMIKKLGGRNQFVFWHHLLAFLFHHCQDGFWLMVREWYVFFFNIAGWFLPSISFFIPAWRPIIHFFVIRPLRALDFASKSHHSACKSLPWGPPIIHRFLQRRRVFSRWIFPCYRWVILSCVERCWRPGGSANGWHCWCLEMPGRTKSHQEKTLEKKTIEDIQKRMLSAKNRLIIHYTITELLESFHIGLKTPEILT